MDLKSLAGETLLQKAVTVLGERINQSPFWQSNKPRLSNQYMEKGNLFTGYFQ